MGVGGVVMVDGDGNFVVVVGAVVVGLQPANAPRRALGLGCMGRRGLRRRGGTSLGSRGGVQRSRRVRCRYQ